MLRSLRAFWLLASVLGSYGLQYLIVRASFGRLGDGRWPQVHAQNARRLLMGFTRLRGVFIKMGQVISVLGGFLPDVYREQLDALQDSVPPQPFSDVRERLREAFGEGAVERFASFDREPIAAASLAQVHRATLGDGRQVAVKVLYRGIEALIARDLFVLRCFLPIISRVFPVVRFERVLGQLSEMLAHETDFDHERRNMERVRDIFAERPDVVVPQTIEELSSRSVLTMSFEEGWKISDLEGQRAAGISPESVARLLTDSYFTMLFAHHVLHADPHPGNFLVRPGPTLIILDHGAVEPLRESLVRGLETVIAGALTRSSERVLEGAEEMGFVAPGGDRELLRRVGREYLQALAQVRISDFSRFDLGDARQLSGYAHVRGRLRSVMRSVQYPESYFYLERTAALLFGLVGQLDPGRGLPGVAAPLASKMLLRNLARPPAPATPSDDIPAKTANK